MVLLSIQKSSGLQEEIQLEASEESSRDVCSSEGSFYSDNDAGSKGSDGQEDRDESCRFWVRKQPALSYSSTGVMWGAGPREIEMKFVAVVNSISIGGFETPIRSLQMQF
jgi:hypothetical protein